VQKGLSVVRVHGLLVCPPFWYSILFHSVLFFLCVYYRH